MVEKISDEVQEFLGPEIATPEAQEPAPHVVPTYAGDEETLLSDMKTCRDIAEGTAVIIVHNLPGTPILNFSVYGEGVAYAAAQELVEGFTRACSERKTEEVQS